MLSATIWIAYDIWKTTADIPISENGYIALGVQPVSVRRLQSCTITTAAEKTTAAFFMGFPFTKIVVGNKNQIRWSRPRGPPGTSH
jgi:hypothetical protein